jgi:acetyl esterase/lipase
MGERADADAGRAVLYLHGGGYVIGSINTHRSLAARLSRASSARARHRLSPRPGAPASRRGRRLGRPPTAGCSARG